MTLHERHIDADRPIAEDDVLRRWVCLSAYRLSRARKAGEIAYVDGPRHKPFYRPSAVESFIANVLEQPCRAPEKNPSLNSADNGSPAKEQAPSITDSGLTKELEEHAAKALARHI